MPRSAHQLSLSEFQTMETHNKRQSPQPEVTATISSQAPNVPSAKTVEDITTSVETEAAATKIQAVFRGYQVRRRVHKKLRFRKHVEKTKPVQTNPETPSIDTWLRKSDADPFNFIQSVKRKLSEATKKDAVTQVMTNELRASPPKPPIEEQEERYESDFESSALSPSPSEEIALGSDSPPTSQHSLVSVTPDKNDEISLLTSHSPVVALSTSPQHLVAPDVALVAPVSSGTESYTSPTYFSGQQRTFSSPGSEQHVPESPPAPVAVTASDQQTVIASPQLTVITPQLTVIAPALPERNISLPSKFVMEESATQTMHSTSDQNIKELEQSIEAGFGRLTDEINAVRHIFGLPPNENRDAPAYTFISQVSLML
jgi:hypothetical protein